MSSEIENESNKVGLFSWTQRLPFQPQARPTSNLNKSEIRFLERCSDKSIESVTAGELTAYLLHLRSLADGRWIDDWNNLFEEEYRLHDNLFEKVIQLCDEVATILHEHGGISINRIVQKLQLKRIICADRDLSYCSPAHGLVFSLLGWLSLLYIPAAQHQSGELRITRQGTHSAIRGVVSLEMVGRPLDELLRSFGELLPRSIGRTQPESQAMVQPPAAKLWVSHMNAATLKSMANMKIVWVDSLSEHLEFDPTIPSVSFFKCPSFCKIQKHSENATLAIMLREFYEEDERPSGSFSVSKFLGEVLLSYTLLFRDDQRSRKLYQRRERARASLVGGGDQLYVDPCLDELCGYNIRSSFTLGAPVRESYDPEIHFPLLRVRLERIQHYMSDIQPNRFMSLWRDQRDLRLWYMIWAVIILSIIAILIAAVSMCLAAAQVNLARLAYELQLRQGAQAAD